MAQHDIKTLEDRNLLNDTIITFYLKFLENYINQKGKKSIYCFNTHFFVYLQNEYKEDIEDSLTFYKKLDKWGKYINFFDCDYIALPINEFNHWSLVIICNPGKLKCLFEDVKNTQVSKMKDCPKIIYFDSFFPENENCIKVVKRFLIMEYRRNEIMKDFIQNIENINEVESRIKTFFPNVPVQNNTYDCGIYLLTYAELFFKRPKFIISRLNYKVKLS